VSRLPGKGRPRKAAPVTYDTVRAIALALPGVEEGTGARRRPRRAAARMVERRAGAAHRDATRW